MLDLGIFYHVKYRRCLFWDGEIVKTEKKTESVKRVPQILRTIHVRRIRFDSLFHKGYFATLNTIYIKTYFGCDKRNI